MTDLTADLLLRAYALGVFPMAESRDSTEIAWIDPHRRGILPLDGFHISRSLRRRLLHADYQVRLDGDFPGCVQACADRPETWINAEILSAYVDLHERGNAHSLEIWREGTMIGGVYGVTLGAAFFGESMFSRARDGSKLALAWLIARLRHGGFSLFDTQFLTDHLASLGAIEISRSRYRRLLASALAGQGDIRAMPLDLPPARVFD